MLPLFFWEHHNSTIEFLRFIVELPLHPSIETKVTPLKQRSNLMVQDPSRTVVYLLEFLPFFGYVITR